MPRVKEIFHVSWIRQLWYILCSVNEILFSILGTQIQPTMAVTSDKERPALSSERVPDE